MLKLVYKMFFLLLLALILFVVLYKCFTSRYDYWKRKNIPFLKPHLFVGNILDLILFKKSPILFFGELHLSNEHNFFGIYLLHKPALIIKNKEIVKNVLIKDFDYFVNRGIHYNPHDKFTSNMMAVAKDDKWRYIRQKTKVNFSIGKIKNMFPLIDNETEKMINFIETSKENLDCNDPPTRLLANVLAKHFFGIEENAFNNKHAEFLTNSQRMFGYSLINAARAICYYLFPSIVDVLKFDMFDPKAMAFAKEATLSSIETRNKNGVKLNDFIDFLIDWKKEGADDSVLTAQSSVMLIAGFQSTSSMIGFSLYELVKNPDIQDRLREEINKKIENNKNITYDCINSMSYLHMVMLESLRRHPPIATIDRICSKDYNIPGTSVTIEKGTPVFISVYGAHHDSDNFPEPFKFDPERFADPSNIPITYLPFGEGPRKCVAFQMGILIAKVALAKILLKYKLESTPLTPKSVEYSEKSVTPQLKHKLYIKFTPA